MHVRVSAYLIRRGSNYQLTPVCAGLFAWTVSSRDLGKVRERAIERIRKEYPRLDRSSVPLTFAVPGRRLERLRLELNVSGEHGKRRLTGVFPVIVEPRPVGPDTTLHLAYHPAYPNQWFELDPEGSATAQVERAFAAIFQDHADLAELRAEPEDKLTTLSFAVQPPSLLDLLKDPDEQRRARAGVAGNLQDLFSVSVNATARAAEGQLDPGLSRPSLRAQLGQLLTGPEKTPVLVVGPPGSGKSRLIAGAVHDLLQADDYAAHRNLDRVHRVWRMHGRHLIAGMSYVGQWEARCVALLARAKRDRILLWTPDLHAWPALGKTTNSDRALVDLFRGPISRRELIVIGECTSEQLASLERDAPSFAAAFARVFVPAADAGETLNMLLYESRRLEAELGVTFDPRCFRTIYELAGALYPSAAFPGKAIEPLTALAGLSVNRSSDRARSSDEEDGDDEKAIGPRDVIRYFSKRTGLPEVLLSPEEPLDRARLKHELARQVIGQDVAVEAACDLLLSIRAGVCAPGRPYGVFLFTGPTGTGKTELARCIAEYLYGDASRLLRLDMGELNTPDAVERLIGGPRQPDGQLTRAVRAQPFCVLLLDEIEKAHRSVLNLLLQLLDDGRLTDARGTLADFSHAVVILTSNLGSQPRRAVGFGEDVSRIRSDVARAVGEFFPPELFNRIDRVVPFDPLSQASAEAIVLRELTKLGARPGLSERNVFLRVSPGLVRELSGRGYDPSYGARSLKRIIERDLGTMVAEELTRERGAEMRVVYLYASDSGRPASYSEVLREAAPVTRSERIQDLLEAGSQARLRRIPQALATLRTVSEDAELERMQRRIEQELSLFRSGQRQRAQVLFTIDALRGHVLGLMQRLEDELAVDLELQELERRRKRLALESVEAGDYDALANEAERHLRGELHDGAEPIRDREYRGRVLRARRANAMAVLADLVEVELLARGRSQVSDTAQHHVLLELVRLADLTPTQRFGRGSEGLLEWLADAFAEGRGDVESAAFRDAAGALHRVSGARSWRGLPEPPRAIALRLIGPHVREFFLGEHGCHVRRTALGSEVVRVRVLSGDDPIEHLQGLAEAQRRFEAALELGGALPDNPLGLLPIVRTVRFEPDTTRRTPALIEDYRLAHVAERRVRHLKEVLRELWLLNLGAQRESEVMP